MDYLKFSACVNLVKSKTNILEIFSKYAKLRENGKFYVGNCPFHEDKNESLTVNPIEGIYYCFGCHAGGDVFNFMARAENISLAEALELQAKNVGVDIYSTKFNLEDERVNNRLKALTEVNDYARDFYHELLTNGDEGDSCRKYLESRGISKREIEKFQLGFAPNVNGKLSAYLEDYGFKFELILQAGLVDATPDGFLDRLQDCITIPILNQFGQTTALIGQISDFEKKVFYETEGVTSQFIFPRETPIFNSNKLIFGLNAAKNAIVKSNSVIAVDNCLDAIGLIGAGVENVIATFDKTLTAGQAEILTRLAEKIIFCLKDGDALPIDEDALRIISSNDVKFFVAALPKNPSEYISENGKDIFLQKINDAVIFDNYKLHKRTYLIEEKNSYPKLMKSPIIKKMGAAILKVACRDPSVLRYVIAILPQEVFDERHRQAIEYLKICLDENSPPDKEGAAIFFEGNVDEDFLNIIENNAPLTEIDKLAFEDAIDYLLNVVWEEDYSTTKLDALISQEKLTELLQMTKYREF